jgi:poly(3-hydroxybutyrate) depolymerase/peptidoglycan/LPS O-acetylase OafA/YrhL
VSPGGRPGLVDATAGGAAAETVPGATAPIRRPHVVALNLIRMLIIVLVVGVHTLSDVGGTVTPLLGAVTTVFHTSRELFFLLTAFVLVYNYGKRPKIKWPSFWWRRYKFVVPAYVAWSVIYFLADGTRWDNWHVLLHELETGTARYHMYFLLVTMQVYLLFPVVRWLLRVTQRYHWALFGVVCAFQVVFSYAVHEGWNAPGFIGAWLHDPTMWAPSYTLYVIGGALVGWHFEEIAAFTRRHMRMAGLVTLAGLCVGIGVYCFEWLVVHQTPAAASAVFQPIVVIEALAYGWGLLALGLHWSDKGTPGRKLAAAGADCSFGIYLAHPLLLQGLVLETSHYGVLSWIRKSPPVVELLIMLLIIVPIVYLGAWAVTWVLRRTPLSLLLTGRSMIKPWRGRLSRMPRGSKPVLAGAALMCVAILGVGLWAARGASGTTFTATPAVKISTTVQQSGSVKLDRSVYKIKVDGVTREWVQLTPSTGVSSSTPIIIVLQGVNATTNLEINRDHLTGYAELVYPVPLYESWNAGGCCGESATKDVNDVAFIEALVAAVNPGNSHAVTLAGYSNGGRLTYQIACTDPTLVDNYAVVKAMPDGCVVSKRITILQIDSTDDTKVPLKPGDKGSESPAATVEVSRLRQVDGATGSAKVTNKGALNLSVWQGTDGSKVEFAVYTGGGHSFPQPTATTPSAGALIYQLASGSS